MFGLFIGLFVLVFLASFATIIGAGWRTSRMVNKVFSLAEQQIDVKLKESAASAQPQQSRCEHCGSNVPAGIPCPNCGARIGT